MTRHLFDTTHNKFKTPAPKCHTTHKVLKLGNGELLGASCGYPRKGFDIYIGLCYTMDFQHQKFPWSVKGDPIIEFLYRITDGCAPKSPKEFKKMIKWMAKQLDDGKRIHIGCIGGHGRTGTVLAALVAHMGVPDKSDEGINAIQWVRKHHCAKAVESASQVKFLMKHFGTTSAKPSKAHLSSPTGRFGGYSAPTYQHQTGARYRKPKYAPLSSQNVVGIDDLKSNERISFMDGRGSIWG